MKKELLREGFSMIEVIISIGIISILTATMVPFGVAIQHQMKMTATHQELQNLSQSLGFYYRDTGEFPSNTQNLKALFMPPLPTPTGWNGPYVSRMPERDPWGENYTYLRHPTLGNSCLQSWQNCSMILSNGPNRKAEWQKTVGEVITLNDGDDLYVVSSATAIQRDYEKTTMERLDQIMKELQKQRKFISFDDLTRGRDKEESLLFPRCPKETDLLSNQDRIEGRRNIADLFNLSVYERYDPWGHLFIWHQGLQMFYSCGPDRIDNSTGNQLNGDDISIQW
ncbi:type II secretion system protein GspG [Deltaproteobacteria bacterium TL4]